MCKNICTFAADFEIINIFFLSGLEVAPAWEN